MTVLYVWRGRAATTILQRSTRPQSKSRRKFSAFEEEDDNEVEHDVDAYDSEQGKEDENMNLELTLMMIISRLWF